jgi:hypothetical protein
MKLIDDKSYLDVQVSWLDKQIKQIEIASWNVKGIAEKDNKVNAILNGYSVQEKHLGALRELLSVAGLKKLSNTIASAKKRKNSNKKSLQLMLDKNVIYKLEETAKNQSMSISELITASNNLDAGLSIEARIALDGLVHYQKATQLDVLNRLLIEAQAQTVEDIRKTLPNTMTAGNKALSMFLCEDD